MRDSHIVEMDVFVKEVANASNCWNFVVLYTSAFEIIGSQIRFFLNQTWLSVMRDPDLSMKIYRKKVVEKIFGFILFVMPIETVLRSCKLYVKKK